MRDYRKIQAWADADDLAVLIYRVSRQFPREEMYGLTSQVRRAAVSVPSNIAEGSARGTHRDYLHFLHIARASLTEVQYLVHLAGRLEYLSSTDVNTLEAGVKASFVRLHGLTVAVEREAGAVSKVLALITSAVVLQVARFVSSHVVA